MPRYRRSPRGTYWRCPTCLRYVAREVEQCECGFLKAYRPSLRDSGEAHPGREMEPAWFGLAILVTLACLVLWLLME